LFSLHSYGPAAVGRPDNHTLGDSRLLNRGWPPGTPIRCALRCCLGTDAWQSPGINNVSWCGASKYQLSVTSEFFGSISREDVLGRPNRRQDSARESFHAQKGPLRRNGRPYLGQAPRALSQADLHWPNGLRQLIGNFTYSQLLELASRLGPQKRLQVDRGAMRRKTLLICWFCENFPELIHCLQFPLHLERADEPSTVQRRHAQDFDPFDLLQEWKAVPDVWF
jgi:hypothetical protein